MFDEVEVLERFLLRSFGMQPVSIGLISRANVIIPVHGILHWRGQCRR